MPHEALETELNTRPNDGRTDRNGNFIVGSYNKMHKSDAQKIGGVYQLRHDSRQLTQVLDYRIRVSNSCAFTPEGTAMFFTDSPTRQIFVFDYDIHRGLVWYNYA